MTTARAGPRRVDYTYILLLLLLLLKVYGKTYIEGR